MVPKPEVPKATVAEPGAQSEAGGHTELANCPHCGWDLSVQDVVEITLIDKQIYVQSILGNRPFEKTYTAFAGKVSFSFRTLTTAEEDAIQIFVHAQSKVMKMTSAAEYLELWNRTRASLQVVAVQIGDELHEFPDGFSPRTHPSAAAFWEGPDGAEAKFTDIMDHVFGIVLRRVDVAGLFVQKAAAFDRIVSRLASMADDVNFWTATP